MENYLATIAGEPMEGFLTQARENQTVRTIENTMLDGSVSVQVIGQASTRITVEFFCDVPTRRLIQTMVAQVSPLKVFWEDRIWTGIISGGSFSVEPIITPIQERVSFELLVSGVVFR